MFKSFGKTIATIEPSERVLKKIQLLFTRRDQVE